MTSLSRAISIAVEAHDGQVVDCIARAIIVHMDVFNSGFDPKFPCPPATAKWEEYSRVEQAAARLAARAAVAALKQLGATP